MNAAVADLLASLPDALVRVVQDALQESPEAAARAAEVVRLRVAGVAEDDPRYVRAVEDLHVLAALVLQRSQLHGEAELHALASRVLESLPGIVAAIIRG